MAHPQQPLSAAAAGALLGGYVLTAALGTVFTSASRSAGAHGGGGYAYVVVSATLASEALKFCACAAVLAARLWAAPTPEAAEGMRAHWIERLRESRLYAIPAATYLADNNLSFAVLLWLRPSETALLANVSVLVTALVYRAIMKRALSQQKWSALVQLTLGLMVSRIGPSAGSGAASLGGLNLGHLLLLCQIALGAVANVYSEKLLKDWRSEELALQNALLYLYGAALNAAALWPVAALQGRAADPFGGWNAYTYGVVAANAACGLCVSVVLKRLSTMVKVLASGTIMIVTVALSAAVFGREPHLAFYLAAALVFNAIVSYNLPSAGGEKGRGGDDATRGEELLPLEEATRA